MKKNSATRMKATVGQIALLVGLFAAPIAFASEITLKSTDGTINLTGEYVDYLDDSYVIRTNLGELRIAANRVVCEGEACPTFEGLEADVAIVGSDTIGQGMMPLLLSGYASTLDADAETANTIVGTSLTTLIGDGGFGDDIATYQVSSTADNDAFGALLDGRAKIGMSSRRITKNEARELRAAGAGSMVSPGQERIVAIDSMVVATHASNEINALTMDQLRGIFSGKIQNWSEVGGADSAINVIVRDEDTASYDFFMSFLFGNDRPEFLPQGIAKDDQALSNVLFNDRHAIGYLGYAFQRGAKSVALYNECGVATTPDAFSAKTEEYTLNRRMYLYSRADTIDAESQGFLDFVTSPAADGVIAKSGFIDLGILRRSQTLDSGRGAFIAAAAAKYDAGFEGKLMQEMLGEMTTQDRLSTTLRFRTGSSKIDERGMVDIKRLVSYLEAVPAGSKVTFVGFTDDVGAFEGNRKLSLGRAQNVAKDIMKISGGSLDHIEVATAGYGEIAPSACNISERGRSVNRRVEVWISEAAAT